MAKYTRGPTSTIALTLAAIMTTDAAAQAPATPVPNKRSTATVPTLASCLASSSMGMAYRYSILRSM